MTLIWLSRQTSPLNSRHIHLHPDVLMGISNLTCFQLNFSSLLSFADLDHSQPYPSQLMETPLIQTPRLKLLRAVLDSCFSFTLHITTVGEFHWLYLIIASSFNLSANTLSPSLLISHLDYCYHWSPHFHTCPLTQSSQKPK